MHIFPYSVRPGTRAAKMPEQIDNNVKKERARTAIELAATMADVFKQAQIGKVVEVLIEQHKNGRSTGHTSNYLEVAVKGKVERNTLHKVQITAIEDKYLSGEII